MEDGDNGDRDVIVTTCFIAKKGFYIEDNLMGLILKGLTDIIGVGCKEGFNIEEGPIFKEGLEEEGLEDEERLTHETICMDPIDTAGYKDFDVGGIVGTIIAGIGVFEIAIAGTVGTVGIGVFRVAGVGVS